MIDPTVADAFLREHGLDLVVVGSPANVFYLSGVTSPAQQIIGEPVYALWSADHGGPFLVMAAREQDLLVTEHVAVEACYPYGSTNIYRGDGLTGDDREIARLLDAPAADDDLEALSGAIEDRWSGGRIGIERSAFAPDRYNQLTTSVSGIFVPIDTAFHSLRSVKTPGEVDRLRRAAETTEAAICAATEAIEPGTTEQDLAADFRARVAAAGAEPLFVTVSFGTRTAHTHPIPSDRTIADGDLIRWDAGCVVGRYTADIGRTFGYGEVDGDMADRYDALGAGLEAAIDAIRDGVPVSEVYGAGVRAIRESGVEALAGYDPNHLGHGIGLEVYDPPTIVDADDRLEASMVVCVEPPYNELGYGGFLSEDMLLVTASGHDRFTEAPRSLPIVG